jgi:hypothetical protein
MSHNRSNSRAILHPRPNHQYNNPTPHRTDPTFLSGPVNTRQTVRPIFLCSNRASFPPREQELRAARSYATSEREPAWSASFGIEGAAAWTGRPKESRPARDAPSLAQGYGRRSERACAGREGRPTASGARGAGRFL